MTLARHYWLKVVSAVWVLACMWSTAMLSITVVINDHLPVRILAVVAAIILTPGLIMLLTAESTPNGRLHRMGRIITYVGCAALFVRILFQAGSDLTSLGGWVLVALVSGLIIAPALLVTVPSSKVAARAASTPIVGHQ